MGGITLSSNAPNQSPFFGAPGATNSFQTNTLVNQALRPGIGRLQFRKVIFDSLVGTTLAITNEFVDRFITNNLANEQRLQRAVTQPDVLFRAMILVSMQTSSPLPFQRSIASGNMVDNSALNSSTQTAGTGGEIYGPGVIDLNIVISFNRLGPHRLNSFPFFLDENQVAASGSSTAISIPRRYSPFFRIRPLWLKLNSRLEVRRSALVVRLRRQRLGHRQLAFLNNTNSCDTRESRTHCGPYFWPAFVSLRQLLGGRR